MTKNKSNVNVIAYVTVMCHYANLLPCNMMKVIVDP